MKGISTVVATILLLLIVIAIIGFAYTFLSGIVGRTGEQTEEQLKATISQMSKGIWIESASGSSVIVRNLGTQGINASSEISVMVGTETGTCTWDPEMISTSSVSTCTLSENCSGSRVKVIGPSNILEKDCA